MSISVARRGALVSAVLLVAGVLVTLGPPAGAAPAAPQHERADASYGAIAGTYYGHTRSLRITAQGRARAVIYDGCCTEVSDVRYRLSHLHRDGGAWVARATVTRVAHFDRDYGRPPHRGQHYRLRVRNDVAWLPPTNYCGPSAPVGYCGA